MMLCCIEAIFGKITFFTCKNGIFGSAAAAGSAMMVCCIEAIFGKSRFPL